ncbi:MAG TPA: hypothetical protein VGO56_22360 [Pyrinomonadaceae bacterium]|jgi:hypothetical protein|nr:hypothetical protein [Pyrinomonadaceae bacterium]
MQTLATAKPLARGIWIVLLLAVCSSYSAAQSTDVAWPSPVRENEIRGTINARDLGDPRVTDHFYAFTGLPGDVLITLDSRNLNGDIDVFTSSNLRPLLKFTVYAGTASPITKSIYLRKQEDLILRVEGRTPNDDEATYRLHFGGAFEPITSGPLAEHEDALQHSSVAEVSKGSKRVTSVGARIDEPLAAVVEAPTPEPTPAGPTETAPKPVTTARTTTRNTRPRRPVTRKTRPVQPPKPDNASKPDQTDAKDAAKDETAEKPTVEGTEPKTTEVPERPARRGKPTRSAPKPAPAEQTDDSGPRLVIETSDGTLVNRSMGGVRRVTVENGQVVVIGKDGKIQRIPLASVVRMVIQ